VNIRWKGGRGSRGSPGEKLTKIAKSGGKLGGEGGKRNANGRGVHGIGKLENVTESGHGKNEFRQKRQSGTHVRPMGGGRLKTKNGRASVKTILGENCLGGKQKEKHVKKKNGPRDRTGGRERENGLTKLP